MDEQIVKDPNPLLNLIIDKCPTQVDTYTGTTPHLIASSEPATTTTQTTVLSTPVRISLFPIPA
jgi:hypothetical protein